MTILLTVSSPVVPTGYKEIQRTKDGKIIAVLKDYERLAA